MDAGLAVGVWGGQYLFMHNARFFMSLVEAAQINDPYR